MHHLSMSGKGNSGAEWSGQWTHLARQKTLSRLQSADRVCLFVSSSLSSSWYYSSPTPARFRLQTRPVETVVFDFDFDSLAESQGSFGVLLTDVLATAESG